MAVLRPSALRVALLLLASDTACALDDGLALEPPMGWRCAHPLIQQARPGTAHCTAAATAAMQLLPEP
jgi:hypothetical protein